MKNNHILISIPIISQASLNPQSNISKFPKIHQSFKPSKLYALTNKHKFKIKSHFNTQASINLPQQSKLQSFPRPKDQINKTIAQSVKYINAVKQFHTNNQKKRNSTDNINDSNYESIEEEKKKSRLFSYLERDIIYNKKHKLSNEDVTKYLSSPFDKSIHKKGLFKSRKFLKQSLLNQQYSKCNQVSNFFFQDTKSAIIEEIKKKKVKYSSQYLRRRNCAYLDYLSLGKQERQSVLNKLTIKQSIN